MSHHAFLSHNSQDKSLAEELAKELAQHGVHVWFDKWEITPGSSWQHGIGDAVSQCPALLACFGPNGQGPWQAEEVQQALRQAVRKPKRLVIPILLPGGPNQDELPAPLEGRHCVDLRSEYSRGVVTLAGAILNEQAVGGRPPRPLSLDTDECPYRGLEPFYEQHARWMFGRDAEVDSLLRHLKSSSPLLILLGSSGSGKSSLVRAGLVPAIRTGQLNGSYQWRVALMRPGANPLHEAVVATIQARRRDPQLLGAMSRALDEHVGNLRERPSALANLVALSRSDANERFLLVVDQFEEIFTESTVDEGSDGWHFVRNLRYGTENRFFHVIVIVRADFLPSCLDTPTLAEAVQESSRFAVPAMSHQHVVQVVTRPARVSGVEVDSAVAETLAEKVAGKPGSLPLLQHCLRQLWQARDPSTNRITWETYTAVGGIDGAISRTATKMLTKMDPPVRDATRRILCRLVHLNPVVGDARRAARLDELQTDDHSSKALSELVDWRLVTLHEDRAEIVHEALIRNWPTLRQWIHEDRRALELRVELVQAAQRWLDTNRESDELWRGVRLQQASELLWQGGIDFSDLEKEFIRQSVAQVEDEREENRRTRETLERINEELREQRDAANEANRTKSGFLAMVSHELRTPLNAISGYAELLIEEVDDSEVQRDLWRIQRASEHLRRLIDDILDLSKIEAGRSREPDVEEVDLHQVIQEVAADVTPSLLDKGLSLQLEVNPKAPRVLADPTMLRQVLSNLLNNAMKFTNKGTITITTERRADNVRIAIADTGSGIPAGEVDVIFQAFTQTVPTSGIGLGLPISRALAELMNGSLTLEQSIPGQGSTFVVELPASKVAV